MRRLALALVLLVLAPVAAAAAVLAVPLDQAVRLSLRTPAAEVVVGNPEIANVQVSDSHHVIVTGKKSGVTNLIITDARGRPIVNRQVFVTTTQAGQVYVTSGADTVAWGCASMCVAGAKPMSPVDAAQVQFLQALTASANSRTSSAPAPSPTTP